MPLLLKTLREASVELGMPESEIKTLVDLKKVRAVMKKGKLNFAPDELAKIKRQRKTLPESVIKSATAEVAAQVKPVIPIPVPPRPVPPRRVPPRPFGPSTGTSTGP
ncbi:MAG: hypothetical protein EXS05_21080 [Planctomycetaceae bacterium]|nr:hypothetical protein [Planctomycetaceae bacterium]